MAETAQAVLAEVYKKSGVPAFNYMMMNISKDNKRVPVFGALFVLWFTMLLFLPDASAQKKSGTWSNGVVVSANPIASTVGVEILKRGGNAVDAAIATAFALAVTYPQAGNIGGGGFMLIHLASGADHFIDYREVAPHGATRDMYLSEHGEVIEDLSTVGHLAAGVPGTVAGLCLAHRLHGTLPLRDLIEPAWRLARDGFPIDDIFAGKLEKNRDLFTPFPAAKKIFHLNDRNPGDLFVQKDLAATLKRIMEEGEKGFYEGKTAELIVGEMERNRGLIKHKDLESYRAVTREPILSLYRGHEIIGAPLPSSGGLIVSMLLALVEPMELKQYTHHSTDAIHLVCEAEKIIYRLRALYMGDSDYHPSPWRGMLNQPYLASLQQLIDPIKPIPLSRLEAIDLTPPPLDGSTVDNPKKEIEPTGRQPHRQEPEETTHFSVIDQWGNAVSNTYTLNSSFGSGVVVEGAGFLLNNEMDDFSIKPGHPNIYGLVGSEANAIEPGKRMLSSMAPTIILKDGRVVLVVGTPGGSTIPTTVFQVIINVLDYGMSLHDAVAAPRFHNQYLPDLIYVERELFNKSIMNGLMSRGHQMKERIPIGDVHSILVENDRLVGVSDPRGAGAPAGY